MPDGSELQVSRTKWVKTFARLIAAAVVGLLLSTVSIRPAVTGTSAYPSQPSQAVSSGPQISEAKSAVPALPAMPVISNAHIDEAAEKTILRLTASAPIKIGAFTLSAPYRVVIDMPEVRFELGGAERQPRGLIHAWRAGLFATGRSRIVLDTTGPTRIVAATVTPRGDGAADITIELLGVSATEFEAEQKARLDARAPSAEAEPIVKSDRAPIVAHEGPHKFVVVLDPGHGGLDAGTVSPHTGMPEKQVVLEFAKLLEKKLTDSGRYEVYMTRTTDTFIPLGDRVKFARAHHADLLVSIHADAELDRSVRGSTVFTLSDKASDAKAAALAAKENQSDALAGVAADDTPDDVADILIDLVKRETRSFSHALAEGLVTAMSHSGHMVKQEPHRSASLRVLKAYDFPSVLIELGFLSNKDDEAELVSPKWRDQTADAIEMAIDRFFETHAAGVTP